MEVCTCLPAWDECRLNLISCISDTLSRHQPQPTASRELMLGSAAHIQLLTLLQNLHGQLDKSSFSAPVFHCTSFKIVFPSYSEAGGVTISVELSTIPRSRCLMTSSNDESRNLYSGSLVSQLHRDLLSWSWESSIPALLQQSQHSINSSEDHS